MCERIFIPASTGVHRSSLDLGSRRRGDGHGGRPGNRQRNVTDGMTYGLRLDMGARLCRGGDAGTQESAAMSHQLRAAQLLTDWVDGTELFDE